MFLDNKIGSNFYDYILEKMSHTKRLNFLWIWNDNFSFFFQVRLECHKELMKPMETKICEHCGEVFQFSKYTLQTRRAYARHVQLHDHNCKICGENFPNGTQRKFHERSHKEHR